MIKVAFIHHWPTVLGPAVGAFGILIAIIAVRAARLGQGLPAAAQAADPRATVRTRPPRPAT